LSRSFHVVTGHTADDTRPDHLAQLARLDGTLVFLMGLGHLPAIVDGLLEGGMSPLTPAAVLSGGNAPNPAAVRGTLGNIVEQAAGVQPPAVIVVGKTAALNLTP
jgi:uroporphyrinogen III methyltransferase/synthase